MDSYILCGAKICLLDRVIESHNIVIVSGKISQILPADSPLPKNIPQINLDAEDTIVPGFIDVHIHGANGSDVMDSDIDSLKNIASTIIKQGVTRFLATTMTADDNSIANALSTIKQYQEKMPENTAKIEGIHLEGPFLSEAKIGAQNSLFLSNPNLDLFKKWCQISGNNIKKVTIAPELINAEPLIQFMASKKIIPSIGHTNCSAKQAQHSIKSGATSATHLFNAMSGLSHRSPGAATAILLDKTVYSELIVDGIHLSPEITKLAYQIKGSSRIMLITDAMSAQSYGNGKFMLGGQVVTVKGNEARLENGALAGSVLTMNQALKNMIAITDCSLPEAIKMAATTPARNLKINHLVGSIELGKYADITILNSNLEVKKIFVSKY